MQALDHQPAGFEDLLESDDRLIAMHSDDVEAVLVEFRHLCRRSGRSIYHWSDSHGVVSMKAADVTVPGCRELLDALRYVFQSMHYGVYLFTRFEKQLRPRVVEQLRDIAAMRNHRTVILLGNRIDLPARLAGHVRHVVLSEPDAHRARPRLRDGRWVL